MNCREKALLEQIKSYRIIQGDIERLKKSLELADYRMTAKYSAEPVAGGYGGSKVESLGIRRACLEQELARKMATVAYIDEAVLVLNKREADLILYMMKGGSLSGFARRRNIYKSHVYKIRDNALKQMVSHSQKHEMRGKIG